MKNKFERLIKPRLDAVSGMARIGVTEKEIAEHFDVAYSTFRGYKDKYPELRDALSCGAKEANAVIAGVLYQKCTGFYKTVQKAIKLKHSEYDTVTARKVKEWEEVKLIDEEVYYPPDESAIEFWLCNRASLLWSRTPKPDSVTDDGGVIVLPEINNPKED